MAMPRVFGNDRVSSIRGAQLMYNQ